MNKKYVYLFIRRDLSNPQKIVQSCHAAMEMSRHHMNTEDEHPSLVVIGIKSEEKLKNASSRIQGLGIDIKEFYEPLFDNQLTSFATAPVGEEIREHFKKYNLIKEESFRGKHE